MEPSKYILGPLCKRGHNHQGTGRSLRQVTNRGCVECHKEKMRRRRREREDVRARERSYNQQYHAQNSDVLLARKRHEYRENWPHHAARRAKYNAENRETLNAKQRERRRTDPRYREHARKANTKWKLCKAEQAGVVTLEHKQTLLFLLDNRCPGCGREMFLHGRKAQSITWDHDMPISRGGLDVDENLIPLCKSCNSKKKDKTFFEWRGEPFREAVAALPVLEVM